MSREPFSFKSLASYALLRLILFRKHAIQYLKFQNMPLSVRTKILVQDDAENFLSLLEAYYAGIRGY